MSAKNNRIINWPWKRVLYVLIGGSTAISAFMQTDWLFGIIGLLFAVMGLFGSGCAGNQCEIEKQEMPQKEGCNHSQNPTTR